MEHEAYSLLLNTQLIYIIHILYISYETLVLLYVYKSVVRNIVL